MNSKTWISALGLTALLGTGLALPLTASAHEVVKEKRVKVIRTTERDHHRRGDMDRWYVERHREVRHQRWAPPGHRHGHKHQARGHKYGHRKHRYTRHEHHAAPHYRRPVEHQPEYRRHDDNSVRVRIDYDFWL